MRTHAVTSWYLSDRLELPAGDLAEALDLLVREDHHSPHGVTLAAVPVSVEAASAPVRRLRGSVRLAERRRPVPVEVEIVPWSETQCELTIRPVDSRPPNGTPVDTSPQQPASCRTCGPASPASCTRSRPHATPRRCATRRSSAGLAERPDRSAGSLSHTWWP